MGTVLSRFPTKKLMFELQFLRLFRNSDRFHSAINFKVPFILSQKLGTSGTSIIDMGDSADSDIGGIRYLQSSDRLQFRAGNDVRVSIDSNGLKFGSDTAAANALDDYEEGTYTPVLASTGCTFSYSVQLGSYVKIGNFVYLQFNISLSNRTGTTTNSVFLDNVPFNTKNVDNSLYSGGHIGHYFNINLGSASTIAYQIPAVSTNQIQLMEVGDNVGENGIVASELNTNAVIRGSVMYRSV